MSIVSNVIITAQYMSQDVKRGIENLTHFRNNPRLMDFKEVSQYAGGGKVWEADTYMAAINYLEGTGDYLNSTWMEQLKNQVQKGLVEGLTVIIHYELATEDQATIFKWQDDDWKRLS